MATFDPKAPPKPPANENDGIPAGVYLLAIRSFKRRQSKKNKDYLSARIQVIHGPLKNKSFFDAITLDMDSRASVARLSMLTEQTGAGAFDLDSDEECKAALCNKPFKAKVSREINGEYVNNGVAMYLNRDVSDRDREIMDAWVLDLAESQQGSGGGGMDENGLPGGDAPPGTDDDYGFGGGGGRRSKAPDDDIPF